MDDQYDELSRRCPSLGGPVPFRYCRTVNRKLPCPKIPQCWGGKIDIPDFLKKNYNDEELEKAFTPDTRTRVQKIVQIVEEATKKEVLDSHGTRKNTD